MNILSRNALCLLLACAGLSNGAVFVVRHAEKAAAKMTDDPPLAAKGLKRAVDLARVLTHIPLKTIYVTQYRRTSQTAAPTAKAHGLTPVQVKADSGAALAKTLLSEDPNDDVLVVAHSDTIPDFLRSLGASGGPKEELAASEYDDLFIVDLSSGGAKLRWLRYGSDPQ